ncbi:ABC transporter ATP-binding protein/permease [Halosquirtibacter xylanolyticus]|uniref:ABC transporter ATP-binding protein n=1 Tax=Halosquirtibacter xylanolyticus TaxID=3374599 RepID=UPI0037479A91|nr:ABC transporter ATP-binding protein/permease [Prolixibacteraceae bacterium]
MNILSRLQKYMPHRRLLIPSAIAISALSTIATLTPFLIIWIIVKELLQKGELSNIRLAAMALGIAVLGALLYFVALSLSHLAAFRTECCIRKRAMNKIIRMPLGFFDKYTSGEIRKTIDDNASITHTFLAHQLPDLAGTIIMPLTIITFSCIVDWRMGVVCIIPLITSVYTMKIMMGKEGQQMMQRYMTHLEKMNTESIEYIRGIPVVKTFQQTVYSFKNFYQSIMNYKEMVISYTRWCKKPMSLYLVLINSFAFLFIPLGVGLITYLHEDVVMTMTNIMLLILITPIFAHVIMRSMYLSQSISQATEALDRIDNMVDYNEIDYGTKSIKDEPLTITFKNIHFQYPNSDHLTLKGISFHVQEGQHIALVGPSGSGKTTIARLIPRFWEPTNGTIYIGSIPISDLSKDDLMGNISFVFQNTKLFKKSIRDNITFGQRDKTDDEINIALEQAQCKDIIDKMPQGLDTMIGTQGVYLSGGEQQRICLARAILKNAPIVVLDEATAFADPENEHLIHQALQTLTRGKTVITIAHRLSNVIHADQILLIKDGIITEHGTHKQLLSTKGHYSQMWEEYQRSTQWAL